MKQVTGKEKLREYETIFIVRADANEQVLEKTNKRVFETVARLNGKIVRFDNLGRKKLAFPVAKNPKGIVMLAGFLSRDGKTVDEIQRNLRMQDDVVRIHSKRIADDVDPESKPAVELTEDKNKIVDVADEPLRPDRDDRGRGRRDDFDAYDDDFVASALAEHGDNESGRGRGDRGGR